MLTIEATVRGHRLSVDEGALASGSAAFDRVHFSFDESWAGLSKVALFWGGDGEAYGAQVSGSGYATVPWEVLESRGKLSFGVYGAAAGQTTPRITSTVVKLAVAQGAWSEEIENSGDPTPTLIEQFRAAADAAIAGAQAVADDNGAAIRRMEALEAQVFPKAEGVGGLVSAKGTIDGPIPALTIYGKSVQGGTPAPESPVAIATAGGGGTLALVSAGKNLLPNGAATQTVSGVTFTVNADGSVSTGGTASADIYFTIGSLSGRMVDGVVYAVTGCPAGGATNRYSLSTYVGKNGDNANVWKHDTGSGVTFAWDGSYTNLSNARVEIDVKSGVSMDGLVFRPMLRLASIADDTYAPCAGGSVSLPTPNGLPGIPVSSGGNYTDSNGQQWICDTIDRATGKYTQRVAAATIDGTESGITYNDERSYVVAPLSGASDTGYLNQLCSHFVFTNSLTTVTQTAGTFKVHVTGGGVTNLYFHAPSGVNSSATAKAWLAGNNVTVFYPLATPVVTALTSAQVAALDALRSRPGFTSLYAADAPSPEIAAKLCIDIPTYIENRFGAQLDNCFDMLCMAHNDLVNNFKYDIGYYDGEICIVVDPNETVVDPNG